jgi:hypothetical protein
LTCVGKVARDGEGFAVLAREPATDPASPTETPSQTEPPDSR